MCQPMREVELKTSLITFNREVTAISLLRRLSNSLSSKRTADTRATPQVVTTTTEVPET